MVCAGNVHASENETIGAIWLNNHEIPSWPISCLPFLNYRLHFWTSTYFKVTASEIIYQSEGR